MRSFRRRYGRINFNDASCTPPQPYATRCTPKLIRSLSPAAGNYHVQKQQSHTATSLSNANSDRSNPINYADISLGSCNCKHGLKQRALWNLWYEFVLFCNCFQTAWSGGIIHKCCCSQRRRCCWRGDSWIGQWWRAVSAGTGQGRLRRDAGRGREERATRPRAEHLSAPWPPTRGERRPRTGRRHSAATRSAPAQRAAPVFATKTLTHCCENC